MPAGMHDDSIASSASRIGQENQSPSTSWLLPHNRRLRHLHAISIRNLSTKHPSHAGPSTCNDPTLSQTLIPPTKLVLKQDLGGFEHSRPCTQPSTIPASTKPRVSSGSTGSIDQDTSCSPFQSRPAGGVRRRSTLDWANASSTARQRRFEAIVSSSLVHVFFSLHGQDGDEPIYISEIVKDTMNPSFGTISLHSRLDKMVVKIWIKTPGHSVFSYFLSLDVYMRELVYVAKTLVDFRTPLATNSIFFHLTDGIYLMPEDVLAISLQPSALSSKASNTNVLPTCSYDALMRLSSLDVCVKDALVARTRLEVDISKLLKEYKQACKTVGSVSIFEQEADQVEKSVVIERSRLQMAMRRRDGIRKSIRDRQEVMQEDGDRQATLSAEMQDQQTHVAAMKEACTQAAHDIAMQRRRICSRLESVYPIRPIGAKALDFTIRNLALPDSIFDSDVDHVIVSAALGHVALLVALLSFYLGCPLPHEPNARGSNSTIRDSISATTASSIYPLFIRGTPRFRLEYGVFLLNKDIEILFNWVGVKMINQTTMLANLKYLLYVLSATGKAKAAAAGGPSICALRILLTEGSQKNRSRTSSVGSSSTAASRLVVRNSNHGNKDDDTKTSRLALGMQSA